MARNVKDYDNSFKHRGISTLNHDQLNEYTKGKKEAIFDSQSLVLTMGAIDGLNDSMKTGKIDERTIKFIAKALRANLDRIMDGLAEEMSDYETAMGTLRNNASEIASKPVEFTAENYSIMLDDTKMKYYEILKDISVSSKNIDYVCEQLNEDQSNK